MVRVKRRNWCRGARWPVVVALAATLGVVLGLPAANAAIPKVVTAYSAALTPGGTAAGAAVTTTLKITNESSPALRVLGWVKVTVPSAFTVTSLETPATFKANGAAAGKSWTVTPTADGFVLRAAKLRDLLAGKESLTITISGQAPCTAGALTFGTAASVSQLLWVLGDKWPLKGSPPSLQVTGSCNLNKLAILSVNEGSDPVVDEQFDVVVQLQNADGDPVAATSNTPVTLNVVSGTGSLGTTTGTIPAGSTQTTITTSYNTVENDVAITASAPGITTSAPAFFEVLAIVVFGPASPGEPLKTCDGDTTPENPVCATVVVEGGSEDSLSASTTTTFVFSLSEQSCILDDEEVCIGSLIELLGSFAPGSVATIGIEYDASIVADLGGSIDLYYEDPEDGFVLVPDCDDGGSETFRRTATRSAMTVPVVNPKPICVWYRFDEYDGDEGIVALFDQDPRLGGR